MTKLEIWEAYKHSRATTTYQEQNAIEFACDRLSEQAQQKVEALSVELTEERRRRVAAEAEVERLKRGVADVLLKANALNPPTTNNRKRKT